MSNPTETLRAILEAIPHPGGLEALDELETGHGWVYCPACGSCGVGGCCPHFCDKCSDIHDGDNNPVNLGDASGTRLRAAQNRIAELEASRKPQGTVLKETVADLLVEIDAHKAHAAQLREALEAAEANLGEHGCDCGHDDPPCALCVIQHALAATPAESLDAIKRATLEEAWDRMKREFIWSEDWDEGSSYALRSEAAILGPYAPEVKW